MSKDSSIALDRLKSTFSRLPFPDKFSRLVSLLLGYINKDKMLAWPSRARLAREMGCSEKYVQRNLTALRKLGLFHVETMGAEEFRARTGQKCNSKSNSSQHRFNLYRINWSHPLWKGEGLR